MLLNLKKICIEETRGYSQDVETIVWLIVEMWKYKLFLKLFRAFLKLSIFFFLLLEDH